MEHYGLCRRHIGPPHSLRVQRGHRLRPQDSARVQSPTTAEAGERRAQLTGRSLVHFEGNGPTHEHCPARLFLYSHLRNYWP